MKIFYEKYFQLFSCSRPVNCHRCVLSPLPQTPNYCDTFINTRTKISLKILKMFWLKQIQGLKYLSLQYVKLLRNMLKKEKGQIFRDGSNRPIFSWMNFWKKHYLVQHVEKNSNPSIHKHYLVQHVEKNSNPSIHNPW